MDDHERIAELEKRVERLEQFVTDLLTKMDNGIQISSTHNIPGLSYHAMEKMLREYGIAEVRDAAH